MKLKLYEIKTFNGHRAAKLIVTNVPEENIIESFYSKSLFEVEKNLIDKYCIESNMYFEDIKYNIPINEIANSAKKVDALKNGLINMTLINDSTLYVDNIEEAFFSGSDIKRYYLNKYIVNYKLENINYYKYTNYEIIDELELEVELYKHHNKNKSYIYNNHTLTFDVVLNDKQEQIEIFNKIDLSNFELNFLRVL